MSWSERITQGQPAFAALYNQERGIEHKDGRIFGRNEKVGQETHGEPGGAGATMNVRSNERIP